MRRLARSFGIAAAVVMCLVVAACGGDGSSGEKAATPAAGGGTASEGGSDWDAVVAAAKKEGKVTVFSNQLPDQLKAFEKAFEAAYPEIDMTVIRGLITENQPRIEAERASGRDTADFIVSFDKAWVETNAAEGWFEAPTGPAFSADDFDRGKYLHDVWFDVTASIVPITWNTKLYSGTIKSYEDVLDPKLAGGKIGIADVQSGVPMLDFYVFLEDEYGEDFVKKLAAQDPTIYAGTGPAMAAVASGEVAVSLWGVPPTAEQKAGAPVEFVVPQPTFGSRGYGAVYGRAPHSNAAQVAADFMMSRDGQIAVSAGWASPLPNVDGALADLAQMRALDIARLTPTFQEAFKSKWEKLFR